MEGLEEALARWIGYVLRALFIGLIRDGNWKLAVSWLKDHFLELLGWVLAALAVVFVMLLIVKLVVSLAKPATRFYRVVGRAARFCGRPSVAIRLGAVLIAAVLADISVTRIVYFLALIFLAYFAYDLQRKHWFRLFAVSALLLNPFLPLRVDEDTLIAIYLGIGVFLLVSIGFIREPDHSVGERAATSRELRL